MAFDTDSTSLLVWNWWTLIAVTYMQSIEKPSGFCTDWRSSSRLIPSAHSRHFLCLYPSWKQLRLPRRPQTTPTAQSLISPCRAKRRSRRHPEYSEPAARAPPCCSGSPGRRSLPCRSPELHSTSWGCLCSETDEFLRRKLVRQCTWKKG